MVAGNNRFYPNYNPGNPGTGESNRGPYHFPLLRGPSNKYPSSASRENSENGGSSIGRGWPYVTARGTIALRLNGNIMIEMTSDQAIRIVNYQVGWKLLVLLSHVFWHRYSTRSNIYLQAFNCDSDILE